MKKMERIPESPVASPRRPLSKVNLQSGDVLVSFAGQPVRHRMDVELCLLGRKLGKRSKSSLIEMVGS